jgi:hypothetical protein
MDSAYAGADSSSSRFGAVTSVNNVYAQVPMKMTQNGKGSPC